MNREIVMKLIREHIETALWLSDDLPTTPGQVFLRDTLIGALQEAHVLYPLSESKTDKGRKRGV